MPVQVRLRVPKLLSSGERVILIRLRDWSDGLERQGSIPWGSTKIQQENLMYTKKEREAVNLWHWWSACLLALSEKRPFSWIKTKKETRKHK